jgi:GR25 family glycosyltransferase involved in LPS biosynthesis
MYKAPHIKFYVIGMRENFRGAALLSGLQNLSLEVEVIWGFEISELPPASSRALKLQKILYGRYLTLGERACNRAHAKAIRRAHQDSFDISVILEDDAQIPDARALVHTLIYDYDLKQPYLLNLFHHEPLRNRTLRKVPENLENAVVFPTFIIPTATVGYAVNKLAVQHIMTKIDEPANREMQADYPLYYGDDIQFKIVYPKLIEHNYGLESVIQSRGSQADKELRLKRWFWLLIGLFPFSWRSNYSGIKGYSKFLFRILLDKLSK